ncbi:MAG: succinylglutamate desuccinylase/aspartoacylase family protein [Rhodospirillales bacterium]|nr:MAG: succinylglutamate desuccinylase/aspartoacylase family protein [Rhodospirillales bacterium]
MTATRASRLTPDIDLEADGKATGFVRIPHSVHRSAYGWLPLPIARIANGAGPRVLLTAGNHGDEWEGQVALGKLIRALEPANVRGRLLILPSLNFPAAMAGTRTSPIDDGNLNRSFPGDPDGTTTRQIAHFVEHALMPRVDFHFDLHSGGSSLVYVPSTLCRLEADPARRAAQIERMRVFGAPIAYVSASPGGDDRTATAAALRQGVAHMSTELGGAGAVTPSALRIAEEGLLRLLAHIGAIHGLDIPPPPATPTRLMEVVGPDYYVYAPDGGVFEPLVELGDEVVAGQPAARVHFHDTPWRAPTEAVFARAGTVICKRQPGRTERGDCLFHLATPFAG